MEQEPVILRHQALEVLKKSTKMLEIANRLRLQGKEAEAYRLQGEARALRSNSALIMARAGQPRVLLFFGILLLLCALQSTQGQELTPFELALAHEHQATQLVTKEGFWGGRQNVRAGTFVDLSGVNREKATAYVLGNAFTITDTLEGSVATQFFHLFAVTEGPLIALLEGNPGVRVRITYDPACNYATQIDILSLPPPPPPSKKGLNADGYVKVDGKPFGPALVTLSDAAGHVQSFGIDKSGHFLFIASAQTGDVLTASAVGYDFESKTIDGSASYIIHGAPSKSVLVRGYVKANGDHLGKTSTVTLTNAAGTVLKTVDAPSGGYFWFGATASLGDRLTATSDGYTFPVKTIDGSDYYIIDGVPAQPTPTRTRTLSPTPTPTPTPSPTPTP